MLLRQTLPLLPQREKDDMASSHEKNANGSELPLRSKADESAEQSPTYSKQTYSVNLCCTDIAPEQSRKPGSAVGRTTV
jgi:hypothetical protein